jgi:hypothetical protein
VQKWWDLADWQWKVGFTPRAIRYFSQNRQHGSSGATSEYWDNCCQSWPPYSIHVSQVPPWGPPLTPSGRTRKTHLAQAQAQALEQNGPIRWPDLPSYDTDINRGLPGGGHWAKTKKSYFCMQEEATTQTLLHWNGFWMKLTLCATDAFARIGLRHPA